MNTFNTAVIVLHVFMSFLLADEDIDHSENELEDEEAFTEPKSGRTQHRFQPGHPLKETHGHQKRTHVFLTKFIGKRLPDLLDLHESSSLDEADRAENREYYGQAVLILFYPFRCVEDLRSESQSWWEAFLEKEETLLSDPVTCDILQNLQDWHESFCRSGRKEEPDLEEEFEHDDGEENEDIEEDTLMHLPEDEENELDDVDLGTSKEFLEALASLGLSNPLKLKPQPEKKITISPADVQKAIQDMPKRRSRNAFVLPGRELVGERIATNNTSEAILDDCFRTTRIDLMENLEKALRESRHLKTTIGANDPPELDSNFPSIQDHSSHWKLNEKQHSAFILCAAALLKHIWSANQDDEWKCHKVSEEIKKHLAEIFSENEHLRFYLGGAGGTGKSRVVQAFVDYARRWHSSASVVITANCGIAAVLVGGCTLHCALGIQIEKNPASPSQSQLEAWSEVGVLFIDEFSMTKQGMYDFLDFRLRQLKDRMDVPFGGVHLILR